MAGASDYIIKQMMGAAGEQPPEGAAMPQQQGQVATMPQQQGQGGVDPKVDAIAQQLAMVEGTPEQKYKIFAQVIPQIVAAFTGGGQQGGQGGM